MSDRPPAAGEENALAPILSSLAAVLQFAAGVANTVLRTTTKIAVPDGIVMPAVHHEQGGWQWRSVPGSP
jgi:hypothetical protein